MKLRSGRIVGRPTTPARRRTRARVPRTVVTTARRVARQEIRRSHELKRHYRSTTAAASPAAIILGHAVGGNMVQGDAIGEREGAKINVKSLHFRLTLSNTNTALAGGVGWFRFLVVQRLHPEGGLQELFKANANTVNGYNYVTTGDVQQITAPINEKRYKTLLDKKMRILPYDLQSQGRHTLLKRWRLRLNRMINFSTNTATDADVLPNIYYLGFVQWDNSSTVNTIGYTMKTWTYFTDA